jgi:hypothetical protein
MAGRRGMLLRVLAMTVAHSLLPLQATPVSYGATGTKQKASSKAVVEFEGFTVDLTLSPKAEKKLADGRETIVVAAYFTGRPKPDTDKKYVSDMGEIGLGEARVEVEPGQSAHFDKVKLDEVALDQSLDRKPVLLINVTSGRKSSKNNLLDCGIYEDDLKPVQGKSIPISCKLIGER